MTVAMLLWCPRCKAQHIDAPRPDEGWLNPPHATHTCAACGLLWRPSNENTEGVASIDAPEPYHEERIANAAPLRCIGVPLYVIGAVERAIADNDRHADELLKQHSYDCMFFEGDANSLRQLLLLLVRIKE